MVDYGIHELIEETLGAIIMGLVEQARSTIPLEDRQRRTSFRRMHVFYSKQNTTHATFVLSFKFIS